MTLHAVCTGCGPRLVLVHGFTQTREVWGPAAELLAREHQVLRVDLPGHGRSGHADADLWHGAALLGAAGGPATYVGYSLGGRLALHLALHRPAQVERLVLLGATAGIDDPDARRRRAQLDRDRADRLEAIGVARFLDDWLALPLFDGLSAARAGRAARLENSAAGLAASLRHASTGVQEPLWERLAELAMPVLCLAGEHDVRFAALAERMAGAIGDTAVSAVIPGAGHAAHLERPEAFVAAVRAWLRGTGLQRRG